MELAGQVFQIQQGVIVDGVGIALRGDAQFAIEGSFAAPHQLLQFGLVAVAFVHQGEQREQHHLHLLRRGKSGRVVERHGAAVGDEPIEKLEAAHVRQQAAIAAVQGSLGRLGQLGQGLVEDAVLVRAYHPQAPAGGTEVLGEGIHQQGVARAGGEQRTEVVGKGAVDIVGEDEEVRTRLGDEAGDSGQAAVVHLHRRRIAGIDAEEDLDRRIAQLVEFAVRILPVRLGVGVDVHLLQTEFFQLRDLDVGSEGRHADGHLVTPLDQAVLLQRMEDVGHGGRAALHGEEVDRAGGHVAADHLLDDVMADHLLGDLEHARRHRVVGAEDAFHHLVEEGRGRKSQLVAHIAQALGQEQHPGLVAVFGGIALEARLDAIDLRQAADPVGHVGIGQFRLAGGEQAEAEEGPPRQGRQEVGIAATGVEHQAVLAARGELDQFVLEFERTQFGVLGVIVLDFAHDLLPSVRRRPRPVARAG